MGAMALGTVASWTATALPSLRKSGAQLGEISKTEESWIGSIMTVSNSINLLSFFSITRSLPRQIIFADIIEMSIFSAAATAQ